MTPSSYGQPRATRQMTSIPHSDNDKERLRKEEAIAPDPFYSRFFNNQRISVVKSVAYIFPTNQVAEIVN